MVHMSTLVATHVAINALGVLFTLYDISGVFNREITRHVFYTIIVVILSKFCKVSTKY